MVIFYRILFTDDSLRPISADYCLNRVDACRLALREWDGRKAVPVCAWSRIVVTEIRLSSGKPEFYPVCSLF